MSFMFHQAIQTKWLAPTNTMPSRIKAKCAGGAATVAWDHGLNVEDNHARAAMVLVRKMGWIPARGQYADCWHGGGSPDGCGFVFVAGGDTVPVTFGDV